MACSRFEPLIALYVEGDLATPEIEEHLRACAGCRALAEQLERSQAALRSLREEEVPEAALAEVRRRVLDEISSRKPTWLFALRWWHGVAAGVTAAVLVAALSPRPEVPPPPNQPVLSLPAPAINHLLSGAGPRPAAASHAAQAEAGRGPTAARRAAPPQPQEPLLVKMFTDDPNVVIYWLIDQTGD